jgi:hypothetical protein
MQGPSLQSPDPGAVSDLCSIGGRVRLSWRRLPTNPGVVSDYLSISFSELLTDFAQILSDQVGLRTNVQ